MRANYFILFDIFTYLIQIQIAVPKILQLTQYSNNKQWFGETTN